MFKDNADFYPTPQRLIDKMLSGIDFKQIQSVLEPSAGKGDLVEAVANKMKYAHERYGREANEWDIDTVENDDNLQHILRGKGLRVIHDNFLTLSTYKKYDLIVMNPPFSEGDKHLLKALEIQENGGKVICLLNAETLRNPCTNARRDLLRKLEDYHADIQYIENAFAIAERSTYVEIALVKVDIPKPEGESIILDDLRRREQFRERPTYSAGNTLIEADFIKGIVQQYEFEVKAGLKLIAEYEALKPFMLNSFKEDKYIKPEPVLSLSVKGQEKYDKARIENTYIQRIREKYWEALFMSDEFMGLFTSNLRDKYIAEVDRLKDYDFSLYNIYSIRVQINKEMIKALEETILSLFDEFSHKYHWYDEMSKNIHYYNGWKTNQAYKINKKVIIPLSGFGSWNDRFNPTDYRVEHKLTDIEKVFNYLDGGLTEEVGLRSQLEFAEKYGETKKIPLKYFDVTFYKKGTCHIEFTNLDLLGKFNIYGSQHKNWLPPVYGKAKYSDMTPEEKAVVDSFEGEASYNKVMLQKDYYLADTAQMLMLA